MLEMPRLWFICGGKVVAKAEPSQERGLCIAHSRDGGWAYQNCLDDAIIILSSAPDDGHGAVGLGGSPARFQSCYDLTIHFYVSHVCFLSLLE